MNNSGGEERVWEGIVECCCGNDLIFKFIYPKQKQREDIWNSQFRILETECPKCKRIKKVQARSNLVFLDSIIGFEGRIQQKTEKGNERDRTK